MTPPDDYKEQREALSDEEIAALYRDYTGEIIPREMLAIAKGVAAIDAALSTSTEQMKGGA